MNPRERILKTVKGEMPDRVPVCLFIHDEGNFLKQAFPDLDLSNPLECKKRLVALERDLGVDLFIRLLHGIYPNWIVYGGVNIEEQTQNWEIKTEKIESANSILLKSKIHTPLGTLDQEFTFSESSEAPGTYWYACTKKPIKMEKDLDIVVKYEPPMPANFPLHVKAIVAKTKEYTGDDGIVSVWVPGAAFNHASLLIELNDIYSLFLTNFPFYEKLLRYCIERTSPFLKALAEAGADLFCMGGNVPGAFLGVKHYETYVLPFEKKYIDNVRDLNILTLYHNCGNAMALANSYKKLETHVVEPFSPPPLGDGDLAEAKRISDGSYTIVGNVDQINVLKQGTIDDVKRVTRETIETGKPGGRFILQTADYLEYGTPFENIEAFVETGLEYSAY